MGRNRPTDRNHSARGAVATFAMTNAKRRRTQTSEMHAARTHTPKKKTEEGTKTIPRRSGRRRRSVVCGRRRDVGLCLVKKKLSHGDFAVAGPSEDDGVVTSRELDFHGLCFIPIAQCVEHWDGLRGRSGRSGCASSLAPAALGHRNHQILIHVPGGEVRSQVVSASAFHCHFISERGGVRIHQTARARKDLSRGRVASQSIQQMHGQRGTALEGPPTHRLLPAPDCKPQGIRIRSQTSSSGATAKVCGEPAVHRQRNFSWSTLTPSGS